MSTSSWERMKGRQTLIPYLSRCGTMPIWSRVMKGMWMKESSWGWQIRVRITVTVHLKLRLNPKFSPSSHELSQVMKLLWTYFSSHSSDAIHGRLHHWSFTIPIITTHPHKPVRLVVLVSRLGAETHAHARMTSHLISSVTSLASCARGIYTCQVSTETVPICHYHWSLFNGLIYPSPALRLCFPSLPLKYLEVQQSLGIFVVIPSCHS